MAVFVFPARHAKGRPERRFSPSAIPAVWVGRRLIGRGCAANCFTVTAAAAQLLAILPLQRSCGWIDCIRSGGKNDTFLPRHQYAARRRRCRRRETRGMGELTGSNGRMSETDCTEFGRCRSNPPHLLKAGPLSDRWPSAVWLVSSHQYWRPIVPCFRRRFASSLEATGGVCFIKRRPPASSSLSPSSSLDCCCRCFAPAPASLPPSPLPCVVSCRVTLLHLPSVRLHCLPV